MADDGSPDYSRPAEDRVRVSPNGRRDRGDGRRAQGREQQGLRLNEEEQKGPEQYHNQGLVEDASGSWNSSGTTGGEAGNRNGGGTAAAVGGAARMHVTPEGDLIVGVKDHRALEELLKFLNGKSGAP